MNCDDCLYTDIAEWEKDGDPERIKPLIWCKKYDKFCSDVADCKYKTESKAENGNDIEELKAHLYELSYALDIYSAGKDYVALRRTHYNNIEWIKKHGLTDEYFDVLLAHIKADWSKKDGNEAV